jgi:hypothetical protein
MTAESLRPAITGRLDPIQHQGLYGESFVRVLANAAGLSATKPEPDTGEDWTIAAPGPRGTIKDPKIVTQVKSWSNERQTASGDSWSYPLPVRAYNNFAGSGFQLRRYIFLCVVPNDPSQYATSTIEELVLYRSAFWFHLRDHEPDESLPPLSTKTIHVPKRNLLTMETLAALVENRESEAVVE